MPTLHTVTSAAALLFVSPSHLRRTADDMAGILPDYQPLPGQARKFSDNDLRTLQALFTRLETTPGLTRAQLLRELSEKDSPPLIIPDTLPTKAPSSPPDSPGRAIPAQAIQTDVIPSQTALQAFADVRQMIAPLSTLPATLDRLQARIDALESQPAPASPTRAPDSLSLVAAAIATGVLIGALVAAAVWQNSAAVVVCVAVALIAVLVSIIAPLRR